MADVPSRVIELVETFDRNIDTYRSQQYNETQLRREFIDPFFQELGWDVTNKAGLAHAYKDVIHEDAISVGSSTKAPDYCFRIGGTRKFFLEAKKPSIDIKGDPHPAYQLRRYAWSAKLPLSILTDFEEFAVYDCNVRPKQSDGPATARIMYFTYKDYLDKWPDIADIFSKDAILKGSFDKFAASAKKKRGTTTVDTEFLAEIEKWRNMLARIIALRNRDLSVREINFAVQRTIDRIIFLRMCEDRGIETYRQLQAVSTGERTYRRLCEIFEKADQKYNSGLFHFEDEPGRPTPPDTLTPNITIDDKDLKYLLHSLYYPQCPYEFSVLPAEILGNVYEQFLGNIIEVSPGRRTTVVPKPEVKKAGGVYYTPSYIVDYIVKNAVGNLIEGKTPRQINNIKILDPACGSGSFLLGAYTYLLDYHRDWYVAHDGSKHSKKIYQGRGGHHLLTIAEKKRILLNSIFGVDIDSQAVEVTKLSLLLKVLEGEDSQSIENQHRLFHERALPDLASNIKCGNSLIAPDFFDNLEPEQRTTNNEQRTTNNELYEKINPFDWHAEFPQIFSRKNPGFDAIIGNPPYISVESTFKDVTDYYLKVFESAYGRVNSFSLFVEASLALANRNAYTGLITSNRVLTNTQLAPLRNLLLKNSTIQSILTFKRAVFKAAVDTAVIVFKKTIPRQKHSILVWFDINDALQGDFKTNMIPQVAFSENPGVIFNVKSRPDVKNIIQKIKQASLPIENICNVRDGIILGSIKDLFLADERVDNRYEKWLEGNEVSRYSIDWKMRYICYDRALLADELSRKRAKAKATSVTSSDYKKISQSGVRLRTPQVFRQEKILTRQNANRPMGTYDDQHYFVKNSLHCILLADEKYALKYVLGLVNSRLIDFYFQQQIGATGQIFSQMKIAYMRTLPIRTIDFENPADKAMHDKMVKLVDRMLDLHKKFATARVPDEKTKIQRQITTTDKKIDNLVYQLYNLTPEEIKIVEVNT